MNAVQNGSRGGWRRGAVLLVIVGGILAAGVSGLFAEGPDYNNPKLRKGQLVAGDSVTTQRQAGWWNKRWKPATSDTNVAPLPAAVAAKALLDKNSPKPWEVGWVPGTGLAGGLTGRTSKRYTGAPEDIAKQFIAEYRPLITGLAPESDPGDMTFQKEGVRKDPDYTIVRLQQMHRGIPVKDSRVIVFIDPEGHMGRVVANVHPVGNFDVTPALDSAAAWEAVRRAIAPDSVCPFEQIPWRAITPDSAHLPNPVRLTVWPGPSPRLVYEVYAHVWVERYYHRPFQFLLDANTGELLETRQMWRERKKLQATSIESSGRGDTAGPSPVDSSAGKLRPFYRNVPIRRVPQEEWDAIKKHQQPGADSVKVPYDTTRPNPRPYLPSAEDRRRKEEARARFQTAKGLTTPASQAWFYCAAYISDVDWDGDGFDARAIFEWDADTWESSLVVRAVIYGRDDFGNVVLLRETPYYTIYGAMPDIYWTDIWCPYRSLWDFRLCLVDTAQDTVSTLNYGEAPYNGFPIPQDIQMERIQEDAVFVNTTNDPPDHTGGTDMDQDGYAQDTWLLFKVRVDYDSTYALTADVYARDTADQQLFIGESIPFTVTYNNNDILGFGIGPFPGMHSRWDFRIELWACACQDYCLLSSVPYNLVSGLTNVPLERWNEDPRVTTVFCPNPIHSQNDPTLWDQDDADFAVPRAAYKTATLSHLDPPSGGVYHLTGTYAAIQDIESPSIPPPTSPDGLFPFFRDDDGFEAVMCYNWIDRAQAYLQSLGFSNAYNLQIHVDPHGLNGIDNSYYLGLTPLGTGYVAFGDGGTDNAEDADMILHEYGHAVIDNLSQGTLRGATLHGEEWAMEEGFGDYLAASWTDSFYVTGFPAVNWAEWDSRATMGSPLFRRRLDSDKHYPEDMVGEEHDDGEIWSACLWQIKDQIGKRVTDSIALRSFELMWRDTVVNPTFSVGARYILKADSAGYNSQHAVGLQTIFTNRGILPACNCGRVAGVHPNKMWADVSDDVAINPEEVARMVSYVYRNEKTAIIAPPGVVYPNAPDDPPTLPLTCQYMLGDANRDGAVNPGDVIRYVNYVYKNQISAILDNPCLGGFYKSERSPSPIAGGPAD